MRIINRRSAIQIFTGNRYTTKIDGQGYVLDVANSIVTFLADGSLVNEHWSKVPAISKIIEQRSRGEYVDILIDGEILNENDTLKIRISRIILP